MASSGEAWRVFALARHVGASALSRKSNNHDDRPRGQSGVALGLSERPARRRARSRRYQPRLPGVPRTPEKMANTKRRRRPKITAPASCPPSSPCLSCHCFFYLPLPANHCGCDRPTGTSSIRTDATPLQPATIIAPPRSSLQPARTNRKLRIASATSIQSAA